MVSSGGRLPVLRADHRQAHLAFLINVGVIDFCLECDLGGLKGVLGGENDFDPECTFVIRRVVLDGSEQRRFVEQTVGQQKSEASTPTLYLQER